MMIEDPDRDLDHPVAVLLDVLGQSAKGCELMALTLTNHAMTAMSDPANPPRQ